jgi:hypothetical protein
MSRHPRDRKPVVFDLLRMTRVTQTRGFLCSRRREVRGSAASRAVTLAPMASRPPQGWSRPPADQAIPGTKYTKTQMPASFSRFVLR